MLEVGKMDAASVFFYKSNQRVSIPANNKATRIFFTTSYWVNISAKCGFDLVTRRQAATQNNPAAHSLYE